jgi:hypothetical protein
MWSAPPSKEDRIVQAMFTASVSVQVGNGTRFLSDRWLDGESIESSFPLLVAAVSKHIKKLIKRFTMTNGYVTSRALSQFMRFNNTSCFGNLLV